MKTVLFVGGGTLGSLNPLLATAAALQEMHPDVRCVFWGTRQPRDRQVVTEAGFPFTAIPAGKFRRYFSFANLRDVVVVPWATLVAYRALKHVQPVAVATAGSYAAVPVAWAARRLGIPVYLYQQDATLGLANRLIAKTASTRCAVSHQAAHVLPQPAAVIGFALRPDLHSGERSRALERYGLEEGKRTVLVIGGSSGALGLNQKFAAALPHVLPTIQIVHITGSGKEPAVSRPGYAQVSFTNKDLPDVLALADLVITRAGSNVLAELVALGKPMIIVPLPGTHQVQNAALLEERGAVVRAEETLEPESFATLINDLCTDSQTLQRLQAATAHVWDTDGAVAFAQLLTKHL